MLVADNIARKETSGGVEPETTRRELPFTPCVDIYETADEVVLVCDMPGVKPQDLDVRVEEGELKLYGKVEPRQAPAEFLEEEYRVGDFCRFFTLGKEVDPAAISAECREGVLTVHLPRAEKMKAQRVAVTAN